MDMVCFVVFRSLFIVNQQWTLSYGCSIHWCHHCMDLCMELVCCSIHWIFTQIYTDLICCSIHQRHPSYVAVGWLFHSLFGYFLLSFSSTIWMSSFGSIIIFSALCCHVLPNTVANVPFRCCQWARWLCSPLGSICVSCSSFVVAVLCHLVLLLFHCTRHLAAEAWQNVTLLSYSCHWSWVVWLLGWSIISVAIAVIKCSCRQPPLPPSIQCNHLVSSPSIDSAKPFGVISPVHPFCQQFISIPFRQQFISIHSVSNSSQSSQQFISIVAIRCHVLPIWYIHCRLIHSVLSNSALDGKNEIPYVSLRSNCMSHKIGVMERMKSLVLGCKNRFHI